MTGMLQPDVTRTCFTDGCSCDMMTIPSIVGPGNDVKQE